jgi:hypothetical protein
MAVKPWPYGWSSATRRVGRMRYVHRPENTWGCLSPRRDGKNCGNHVFLNKGIFLRKKIKYNRKE